MKLDLHGVKHYRVALDVENFILLNQNNVPLEIICGNSNKMIDIVSSKLKCISPDNWEHIRWGVFIVRKV